MVICNLRFSSFNLQEEDVHCPRCKIAIRALTSRFRKCLWMFEGRKTGFGNVDVASEWMVAGRKYERFDEHAERATAGRSSLIIAAKKLPSSRNMKSFHGNGECTICLKISLPLPRNALSNANMLSTVSVLWNGGGRVTQHVRCAGTC